MALIICPECGKEISDKATACPNCGAPLSIKKYSKKIATIKDTKYSLWSVILGIIFVGWFASMVLGSNSQPQTESINNVADEKSIQEKEMENKVIETKKGMAMIGAKALHDSMKNPASLKFSTAFVTDNNDTCYEYRAENSFGGMAVEFAILTNKGNLYSNKTSKWNKLCVNKNGKDVTSLMNIYVGNLN